jgi:trimethylamine---corrinoid protein Co-methyltransferase
MKLSLMTVLSNDEIDSIHEASVDILSTTGVQMGDAEMLTLLKAKGLEVRNDTVRFSRSVLEDAIAEIPNTIDVFDREGDFAFTLGDGDPKIAAGHNAVFWVDSETGETRSSRVSDVETFSRICENLEYIHMIGIPVMPQDVPNPRWSLLYAVRAVVENSAKPVFYSTDNQAVNRGVINLLEAAYGGDFSSEVYGISQLSPTSPLYWEKGVTQAIRDTLTTNVPLAILPEPNAGVSAPYTLAGLLTVNNAECLSGLAMIQLLRPGAAVMYANSWTAMDMRTGAALVGSTETSICRVAGAQLARYYGVPSHTTAPNSDNHTHDEQNAWEKTYSMMCSVAAGNDLVVNCGMFATGLTCSNEQLIMDEEISAMAKRITSGIEVTEETIAADLIKDTGPRGEYLSSDHTLAWLRRGEHLEPRVSVRTGRETWLQAGGSDTYALAKRQAAKLDRPTRPLLDNDRIRRVQEICSSIGGIGAIPPGL